MRHRRSAEKNGYTINGYRKCATATLLTVALIFCTAWSFASYTAAEEPLLRSSAAERLRQGLFACETQIDLTVYTLPPAEVGQVYAGLLQDDPLLFHVAPRLSYAVSGDRVTVVYPVYTLTGTDLSVARAFCRDTVAGMLADMEAAMAGHPRTEAEVALMVHDMLAARYDYDVRALTEHAGDGNRDIYTFFRDGVGVCQAYALAAMTLLRGAGLEADFVSSPAMDHAWVHVRVGGVWYHMDVTRDDPVAILPDGTAQTAGAVTHTRVLRSDAGMQALGYHGFSCAGGHLCTDGRYETPEAMVALSELSAPLRVVSVGKRLPLVWVGETAGGALLPLSLTNAGVLPHQAGDIDGDGQVTPGDLLLLSAFDAPENWRRWMRQRVVEA